MTADSVQGGPLAAVLRRSPAVRAHGGPVLVGLVPLVFLAVLFLIPVLRLMELSVEGGTLANFEKALTDGLYVQVMLDTMKIAVYVTGFSLLLAYPIAFFLASAPRRWVVVGLIFLLVPFWTSILVRTYAWMILLGRNGIVNQVLLAVGLTDEPLPLLYNTTGVVIGMVHVLMPYMVFPIYTAMLRIDGDLILAAAGLGASGYRIFRRVFLPLTLPGVLAGSTLVFILALGFFITPALLGGGRVIMVAVLIEQQVRQFLNWGFAAALSIVLLATAVIVFLSLHRLMRTETR